MKNSRFVQVCLLWTLALVGAAWAAQRPAPQPLKKREGNEKQRAAWFFRGRQATDQQSAAQHLFKARTDARTLRVAMPRPSRSAGGATVNANWTPIGPAPEATPSGYYNYGIVSGRVTALAVDLKGDPTGNTLYVGTANGGVWKSTDALSANPTFTSLTDATPSLAIGSIAVDSSTQPATIYVGTGEGNNSGDAYYGVGILRSTDGGQSWQTISYADNGKETFFGITIDRILIDPANPQHLLAAAGTSLLNTGGPYPNTGIYQSTDGGQSWSLAAQFRDTTGTPHAITDLVYDASSKLYYAAVSGMGIYSSPDAVNWTELADPLLGGDAPDAYNFSRASLAVRNGVIYVLYCEISGNLPQYSATDTGLLQSTDRGQTWTPIAAPDPNLFSSQGTYDQYIAAPANSTELIVGGIDVWEAQTVSGDSTTWTNLTQGYNGGVVHTDQHAFAAISPTSFFVGNDGGVWSTADGGTTWTDDSNTLATIQFYSATPNSGIPGMVIGGSQDNGTSVTNNDGTQTWTESLLGDGGFTDVDPADPSRAYGEEYGISLARSNDGGKTFNEYVVDSNVIQDPSGFFTPYEVIPSRPWLIAMGTYRLWIGPGSATYDGQGWQPVSPALTQSYITGLAVAPSDANVIYTVGADGTIEGSTNALAASPVWNDLTAAPLPTDGSRPLSTVAVNPTDPNTVYVGVMGFGTGHVFKSTDGGASWMDVTGNLPDAPVNSIAIDPENPTNIYVASDAGVFVATDGGVTGEDWQQMGSGLPETPVMQIKFSNVGTRVLIAATHGRGAWTIAPLTNNPDFALQLTPDLAGAISGQPTTLTATVAAVNGYTGNVTLSCQAPSTGCSVQPATVQPGQSATITLAPDALPGDNGTVTVSATDGTLTHTQNAQVQSQSLLLSTDTVDMEAGDSGSTVDVAANNLTTISGLACQNLPAGVTCQFTNPDLTPESSEDTLQIVAGTTAVPGTTTIQIAGTENGQTLSAPLTVRVHGFHLSTPNPYLTAQGTNLSATVAIQSGSLTGSTTPITLACDPASGVTCSFSPASIVPGQSSTLTISNFTQTAPTFVHVHIIGTAGADQQTLAVTVKLPAPDSIQLSGNPSTVVVAMGSDSATFQIFDMGSHGSNETVNYSCVASGGVQCAFSPGPSTSLFTVTNLTVSGLSQLPAGAQVYSFQVQASLNSLQQTLPLQVQFGDFAFTTPSVLQPVMAGTDAASFAVTTSASGGFNSAINFSCSAPTGVNCSVTPASVNPGQAVTVQLSGLASMTPQDVTVDVTGTSGQVQHDLQLTTRIADFALSTPRTTITVPSGTDTETFAIHASAQNDAGLPIALGCKTSAAVTCSFSPANLVGGASSTLTISGLNAASASGDNIQVGVTGLSQSDTHTLPLTLNLQDFAPAPPTGSATSETILAGQTAKYSLTYSSVNGFSGPVTLACQGGPVPSTCVVSPASFNLGAGGSQAVIVSVSTVGGSQVLPFGGTSSRPWGEGLVVLGALGLLGMAFTRRRQLVLAAGLLLAGALLLAGCGGSGGGAALPRTTPGTTTVTITATSNGVSRSTKLALTVQ